MLFTPVLVIVSALALSHAFVASTLGRAGVGTLALL
jgi:hypothetical protein